MESLEFDRWRDGREATRRNNGEVEIRRVESEQVAACPPTSLETTKMSPTTIEGRNLEHIKGVRSDELISPHLQNVTEIDGGILEYVRVRMHRRTVTPEVRREAVAFEREMSRMQGW